MNDQGIAWMIAGGVRAESAEDRRQRLHRLEIANSADPRMYTLPRLRDRIAAIVGGSPAASTDNATLSADCCPA